LDLWWYALGVGVGEGRRTPVPDRDRLVRFARGDILEGDPWRVTHLELLALAEEGQKAATNATTVVRIGNEYALTGFADLAEELRGVIDAQNHLIDFAVNLEVGGEAHVIETPGARGNEVNQASTEELIALGESKYVEFKQTGRINLSTKGRDSVIEHEVVRTIAGFMNSDGGTLLIGVTDSGEVFGIEKDLKTLGRKQDTDGFALWLNNLLDNTLGPVAAAGVKFQFDELLGRTICRVDVIPGKTPTYLRGRRGEADFHIRLNNATRRLNTEETVEYLLTWGR